MRNLLANIGATLGRIFASMGRLVGRQVLRGGKMVMEYTWETALPAIGNAMIAAPVNAIAAAAWTCRLPVRAVAGAIGAAGAAAGLAVDAAGAVLSLPRRLLGGQGGAPSAPTAAPVDVAAVERAARAREIGDAACVQRIARAMLAGGAPTSEDCERCPARLAAWLLELTPAELVIVSESRMGGLAAHVGNRLQLSGVREIDGIVEVSYPAAANSNAARIAEIRRQAGRRTTDGLTLAA